MIGALIEEGCAGGQAGGVRRVLGQNFAFTRVKKSSNGLVPPWPATLPACSTTRKLKLFFRQLSLLTPLPSEFNFGFKQEKVAAALVATHRGAHSDAQELLHMRGQGGTSADHSLHFAPQACRDLGKQKLVTEW
eukprot:1156147-Pelagomonas_calceolata.AAC.8